MGLCVCVSVCVSRALRGASPGCDKSGVGRPLRQTLRRHGSTELQDIARYPGPGATSVPGALGACLVAPIVAPMSWRTAQLGGCIRPPAVRGRGVGL